MAAHKASGSKMAAFTQWFAAAVAAVLVFSIGCIAGYQAKDSWSAPPFWIVFGGNQDPGDGNGGGNAASEFVRLGWTSAGRIYQVKYSADVAHFEASTQAAVEPGIAAYKKFCGNGCVIAGFSQGTDAAIELSSRVGNPAGNLYLFGGPHASTGLWHHPVVDHPLVDFWLNTFGFSTGRVPPAGAHNYFKTRDPYNNPAPQCVGPGLYALAVSEHVVVGPDWAAKVWTGPDGVDMHEAGYVPPPGLPFSGSDYPPVVWQGCPPGFGEVR